MLRPGSGAAGSGGSQHWRGVGMVFRISRSAGGHESHNGPMHIQEVIEQPSRH